MPNTSEIEVARYFRRMYTRLCKMHPIVRWMDDGRLSFQLFRVWCAPTNKACLTEAETHRCKMFCRLAIKMVSRFPDRRREIADAALRALPQDLLTEYLVYTVGFLEAVKTVEDDNELLAG